MRWTMRRMRSRSCCCQRLPLPREESGGEGGEGGGGEPLPATSSLAPTAEAVAESAAEPAAGEAAGRRGAARLTHAQAAELLERIREVRKQPTSSSTMVHGWRIEWKMRHASLAVPGSASTSSRAPQGDLAVYEAGVSKAPYRSLAKLQERLGLVEGKASAAAEAESKAESKAVAKAVAKARRRRRVRRRERRRSGGGESGGEAEAGAKGAVAEAAGARSRSSAAKKRGPGRPKAPRAPSRPPTPRKGRRWRRRRRGRRWRWRPRRVGGGPGAVEQRCGGGGCARGPEKAQAKEAAEEAVEAVEAKVEGRKSGQARRGGEPDCHVREPSVSNP